MKITIDRSGDGTHTTIEREPMPQERFEAVCKLTGLAIGGIVLLGLTRMVGMWAVGGAVVALVAVGIYRLLE